MKKLFQLATILIVVLMPRAIFAQFDPEHFTLTKEDNNIVVNTPFSMNANFLAFEYLYEPDTHIDFSHTCAFAQDFYVSVAGPGYTLAHVLSLNNTRVWRTFLADSLPGDLRFYMPLYTMLYVNERANLRDIDFDLATTIADSKIHVRNLRYYIDYQDYIEDIRRSKGGNTPAPEPATAAMLGLAILAAFKRKIFSM
jgi:hypothetical protein